MATTEALQLLYRVWGRGIVATARDVAAVEAVELPGETMLDTVCRVAGVDRLAVTVGGVPAVRRLCELRATELGVEVER